MNRPGVFSGILFALAVSIAAAVAQLLLSGFVPARMLLATIVAASALGYLFYLLKRSPASIGRVVTIGFWAAITTGCWLIELALIEQVLIQAGYIWLIRSLYFHKSIIAALFDLALVLVGLAAAAWAISNTASLAAALWSFLLTQSLFGWIPEAGFNRRYCAKPRNADSTESRHSREAFYHAHRAALDAVRKLTTQQP